MRVTSNANFSALVGELEKEARNLDFGKINLTVEIREREPFRFVVSREQSRFLKNVVKETRESTSRMKGEQ